MKIHIPVQLRSALLACLAVLPMPMATSIMTGTLTVGAVSYVLSQQQAQAATVTYIGGGGGEGNPLPNTVAETDDLVFNITQGWVQKDNGNNIVAKTYVRHILVGTISDNVIYRFNNAVADIDTLADYDGTGVTPDAPNGGFYFTANTSAVNNDQFRLIFEGAMKDFSGDIVSTGSGMQLELEDFSTGLSTQEDRNASASGTGNIKIGGRQVRYNMTGNVTVNNTTITVSNTIDGNAIDADDGNALDPTLVFTNTGSYAVSAEILADKLLVDTNATVSFSKNVTSTTSQQFLGTTSFTAGTSSFTGTTSITGSLTIADGAAVSLLGTTALGSSTTNNGQLTLGGTVTFTQTMAGTGTVTVNGGTIFDLTNMANIGTGNDLSYQLFADGMTVTEMDLTAANIAGVSSGGREWTLNTDGTLTGALTANQHTITGDVLDLGVGTDINGTLFEDGDLLTFTTAPSTITLTENVNSGYVTIDGVAVTLTGAGNTLDTIVELKGAGSLILMDGALAAGSTVTGADGSSVVYDLGAGVELNNEAQLAGYTGDVIIKSGELQFADPIVSLNAGYDLIVQSGGSLSIAAVGFTNASITLEGGALIAETGVATAVNQQLTSTGDSSIQTIGNVVVNAGLAGSGSITKSGAGYLNIQSSLTHTGTLDVTEGNLQIGGGQASGLTVAFDKIIMRAGTTWYNNNSAANYNTVQMDGGTFNNFDMDAGTMRVARMEVTADSFLQNTYNGLLHVEEFTGNANLTYNPASTAEAFGVSIGEIIDYSGTIDMGGNGLNDLSLSTVTQGAGMSATITNVADGITSTGFTMQGEGSLTLNSAMSADSVTLAQEGSFTTTQTLTTSAFTQTGSGTSTLSGLSIADGGSLTMHYNGTLDINTLTLGANLQLKYTAGENLFALTEEQLATVESYSLNIIDVERALLGEAAGGYDLGLAGTVDEALISVFGLDAGYSLDNSSGTWKLTLDADAEFDFGGWDLNWGVDVIAQAPETILTVADATGTIYMSSVADYVNAGTGTTSALFTDSADVVALVVGGKLNGGDTVTDSWIQVTGGTFVTIAGGNQAQWNEGANTFTGDSHIVVNQETEGDYVQFIIGGNYQDGNGPTFTGDSYISVYTDTVTGSIIGGSTNAHQNSTTFNGHTNIFVYSVLSDNSAGAMGPNAFSFDMIIGSNSWLSNSYSTQTSTHNGDSNITVDLSGQSVTEATNFGKLIAGGALGHNALKMVDTGDTNVTITGTANVTFNQKIIGGGFAYGASSNLTRTGSTHVLINANGASFDTSGNEGIIGADNIDANAVSIISGSSNLTINGTGSTFADRIMGGGYLKEGSLSILSGSNITINGGSYSNHVTAGSGQLTGTVTTGGTSLTITEGTFTGLVMGGSVIAAGTNVNTAGSTINISGGSFVNVHGGSIDINNTSNTSTAGLIEMNLTGGTFTSYITGGSVIGAAYAGTTTADGGVTINIDGATMNGNIIGGHIRTTGTTAATVSMGDVAINLISGNIGADVHAAGHLTTAFTGATTASTRVTVGSAVTFNGTNQIINGDFGGAAAASGTVTGDRTLAFSDNTAYGNIAAVSYRNFDVVEVTEADAQVSITGVTDTDSLTKTGAGTLTLTAAQNDKSWTASEGTLALQADSTLTNLAMAGGTLSLTADPSITVTDELSITGGGLSMNKGYTGIALDTDASLTLNAGSTLDLSIIGALADEDIEQVIFSGVDADAANLTGITLEKLDNGELGVSASALFGSIDNGDIVSYTAADMFLVLRDGNLVLVSTVSRNLHWAGGDTGNWGMDNDVWQKEGEGDLIDFERNDNVFFTAAQDTTITMDTAVDVYKMTVSGAGSTYTFAGDAANSITVLGSLTLENGADVTFDTTVDLTTAEVSVGANSVLTSMQTTDLTIKSLVSGGDVSLAAANTEIMETVATGGNLTTSGNLSLADGENAFTKLVAETVTADSLSIAGGSDITTFSGSSLSITEGAVTIDNMGTLDSFVNHGTVTTTGDLTFSANVAIGGVLYAGNVTLQGAVNSFTTLTADAVTQTADATLTVFEGANELASISGGSLIIADGSLSVTEASTTTLDGIAGGGSLSTAGDLTLTSEDALTIGSLSVTGTLSTAGALSVTTDLSVNHLSLNDTLSVGAGNRITTTGSALSTISINYTPLSTGPAITGGSFNSQALRFDMSNDVLLSMGLRNGDSYVLADMAAASTITGLYLNSDTASLYVDTLNNYTISQNGNDIIITLVVKGNDWQGDISSAWSDAGNWVEDVPDTDRDAVLADAVNTNITLGDDAIARNVRVEMTSGTGNYNLSDGDLTAETLSVVVGQLTLKGDATVSITDGNNDGTGGLVAIAEDGKLILEEGANLNATKLTLNENGTLTSAGDLTVGELSATERTVTNTGALTLGDGSTIGTLTGAGGTLALVEDATVNIGTMSDQALNLAAGSELKVADDTTLSTMSGTGSLSIGTGAKDTGLTVATGSSGITSGTLYADTLTLEEGSSARFTQLSVNTIVIHGDLATNAARLGATQLGDFANSGIAPTLNITSIDEMTTGTDGVAMTYYVYEQAGANWSSIILSDATKMAINKHIIQGNDILLTTTGDSLTFTMQESTDRLWKVSENFAVTAQQGADLSVLKPIYDEEGKMMNMNILDTVDRVYVDASITIDLVGVANSTGNPLLVQNLTGDAGTRLSIVGDGIDQDTVALRNTEASFAENALDVKDATITSQSFSDGSSSVLDLGSLNLNNAALEVLSPAGSGAVTGAPTGLTVGQLTNVDAEGKEVTTSVVEGLLSINGAGAIYTGGYDRATLNMMQGADQALKAGDGLTVSGNGGHVHIIGGADAVMDQIKTTGADVTIDFSKATAADQALTIDKASTMEGGTLTLVLNKTLFEAGEVQQTLSFANTDDSLTLSASSALHITVDNPSGLLTLPDGSATTGITIAGLTAGLSLETDDITLGGGLEKLFTNVRYENGEIIGDINASYYSGFVLSANGQAGYNMLNEIVIDPNPEANPTGYEDLAAVIDSLDDLLLIDRVAADKLAAGIAGASTASIGMAVSGDMSRQLGSIRNRTMNMGSDPEMDMEGELNFKGWISAEGGSSELSGEGTLAGYDLSSWGGTVGAELDLNSQHTIGLAFSALYGDFSSSDVDAQSGDINTNYLSFFARSYSGRWSHSFVASVGMSDISSTRTVTHSKGYYDTDVSTNGMSYGALYEVAYTCAMTESGSTAWQPLASISYQSSTVDGYTETGSDAALMVGEQSVSYATLALGARVETIVGENMYNRASTLSLRAMAKADLGDTSSSADVSLLGNKGSVESQERGQYALELGAGLQIPIKGDTSHLFIDTSVEVRENQTNVNGSAGYRFSF